MLIDLLHRQIRRRYHHLGFKDVLVKSDRFTVHSYLRAVPSAKDTLVLVHGLGTSSSTWIHILPDLDPAWNVLTIDLPGFGFSTVDGGEPFARLPEHVNAIAAVIDKNLTAPFLLLGHSLGGWIAARYALQHPANVAHLILADSAGILCDDTAEQGKAFQVDSIADLRRLLNKVWLHYPWYFRPFYPAVLHDMRKRSVREFVQSVEEKDFLNPQLRELGGRTSVIWGSQDRLTSLKAVGVWKMACRDIEVHVIERCGHVPQLERPAEFLRVLHGILERERSSAKIPFVV